MNDYLGAFTDPEKVILEKIAQYAYELGYKSRKDKTQTTSYSFIHKGIKRQVLRFSSSKGKPVIKIKFFASNEYSIYFQEAIRQTIEEYDYRYTGCYGCGKCDGTQGYMYHYPDGRSYFRCGIELIELFDIDHLPFEEFLTLLKTQHDHYLANGHLIP